MGDDEDQTAPDDEIPSQRDPVLLPDYWSAHRETLNSLARSNESLKRAVDSSRSWAQAIAANAALGEEVKRTLAGLEPLWANDELRRTLLNVANRKFSFPELKPPKLGFDEGWKDRATQIVEQVQLLQRQLGTLNVPEYATRTQTFLTDTDALKYSGRQRLWHYTSASALHQILRNHVLWASSPHHLNDTSELHHGVDTVDAAIRRASATHADDDEVSRALDVLGRVTSRDFVDNAMHDIYYISASTASDSLTLWRNYSTADGFAVGISPSIPLSADGLIPDDADLRPSVPLIAGWYRIHYREAEKARLADAFVRSAVQDIVSTPRPRLQDVVSELRKHLLILASTMKHRAFEDEREVRWITTQWAPLDIVHYELTGKGIVPVLHARTVQDETVAHLPLRGIRCSPTTAATIEHTMRGLLRQRGYEAAAADVVRSTLPFRG